MVGISLTQAFLTPLSLDSWMSAMVCGILLLLVLKLKANYEKISQEKSWSKMCIVFIGALSQQGEEIINSYKLVTKNAQR